MRTDVVFDRADKRIIAVTTQDTGPILDRTAALRAQPQRSDFGRHIASIPNMLLVQWLNEEYARGNTDLRMFTPAFNALVARKLADSDWKHLRVDQ